MSDAAAAPAATPAPAPAAPAQQAPAPAKPTFDHPHIPPLRAKPGQQRDTALPEPPPVVEPATDTLAEAEAKPEPEQKSGPREEVVQYDPDDVFDVITDGKKSEVTLAKLIAYYQRGEAANERFAQAKQLHHQATEAVKQVLTHDGFIRMFQAAGIDPWEFASDVIFSRAEYERMTPEQRELHDLRERERAWKAQQERQQREGQQTQAQQHAARFQAQFIDQATATMDKVAIPGDPALRAEIMRRAAGRMRDDIASGYESTPAECVRDAWDEYREALTQHARALPVEHRVSDQERAELAKRQAAERVRVAEQAPRAEPPRDDRGRFQEAHRKPKMDMWSPAPRR